MQFILQELNKHASELSGAEYKLLVSGYFAHRDNNTGMCMLARRTLQLKTGICYTDITRIKHRLAKLGIIALVGDHVLLIAGFTQRSPGFASLGELGWRKVDGIWVNKLLGLRSTALHEFKPRPTKGTPTSNGHQPKAKPSPITTPKRERKVASANPVNTGEIYLSSDNQNDDHSSKKDSHSLENDSPSLSDTCPQTENPSLKKADHSSKNEKGHAHVRNLMSNTTTTTPLPPQGQSDDAKLSVVSSRLVASSASAKTTGPPRSRHPKKTLVAYGWANVGYGIKNPAAWAERAYQTGFWDDLVDGWLDHVLNKGLSPESKQPPPRARSQQVTGCEKCHHHPGWIVVSGNGARPCDCQASRSAPVAAPPDWSREFKAASRADDLPTDPESVEHLIHESLFRRAGGE